MGADFQDLDLGNDQIEVPEQLPDQPGRYVPPPQPGSYVFRLPEDMRAIWEPFDAASLGGARRVWAVFDDEHPLTIVQSPDGTRDGETFRQRISNAERARGRDGVKVSDMTYLLRALGEDTSTLRTNQDFVRALLKHAGETFKADIEYSANCNENRNIYVQTEEGGFEELDQKGCGKRYYQRDFDKLKQGGVYPDRITCEGCGASLRAFPNLTRFAPVG